MPPCLCLWDSKLSRWITNQEGLCLHSVGRLLGNRAATWHVCEMWQWHGVKRCFSFILLYPQNIHQILALCHSPQVLRDVSNGRSRGSNRGNSQNTCYYFLQWSRYSVRDFMSISSWSRGNFISVFVSLFCWTLLIMALSPYGGSRGNAWFNIIDTQHWLVH